MAKTRSVVHSQTRGKATPLQCCWLVDGSQAAPGHDPLRSPNKRQRNPGTGLNAATAARIASGLQSGDALKEAAPAANAARRAHARSCTSCTSCWTLKRSARSCSIACALAATRDAVTWVPEAARSLDVQMQQSARCQAILGGSPAAVQTVERCTVNTRPRGPRRTCLFRFTRIAWPIVLVALPEYGPWMCNLLRAFTLKIRNAALHRIP